MDLIEKDNVEKKTGVIKRSISTVANHVQVKRELNIPTWLLYIIGVIGVIGLVFGGIQQARIWRWDRIMKASQVRIAELESDNKQIELEVTKKIALGKIDISKKKINEIDKQMKVLDQEQEKIKKDTARMSGEDLKNAFRGEGFKDRGVR